MDIGRGGAKWPALTLLLLLPVFALGQSGTAWPRDEFLGQLADSTLTLTRQKVSYDPGYYRLAYPNGDVPANRGVCTDVVVRAYRKMGIDLQKEVHEDMTAHFDLYPHRWGLTRPDPNIDHRRVPNLMVFFTRHGMALEPSGEPDDYRPGDVVCWDLGRGITHIGIVSPLRSADGRRHRIVHNIGGGQVLEDCLFRFPVIGHYRYPVDRNPDGQPNPMNQKP
ncbi:MAG: DUF1287 domain-containing protein [Bacteroidales bacterium]